jgi:hypothetical protein
MNRKGLLLDRSNELIFPCKQISLWGGSDRTSQKRIFLSKWPLMIDCESNVTKSLQLEPANRVFMPSRGQLAIESNKSKEKK